MAVSNEASGGWGNCPMNWLLPRHKLEQVNSWAKGRKQIHMLLHGCTKLNDTEDISGDGPVIPENPKCSQPTAYGNTGLKHAQLQQKYSGDETMHLISWLWYLWPSGDVV